ncbi:MAG: HesB/YadR/YfhF-family protein [Actinobacteria bacterium]|nr:HesB/YadR/YfhF-family protein [Actinomycetota bacterium]
MLTISPTATEAIRLLVENAEAPESAGIRIAAGEPTEQGTPLELALVDSPEPGDEVIAADEATVFLEPQVAPYLADTILDAQVSEGEIAFALHDSDPATPASRNGSTPDE